MTDMGEHSAPGDYPVAGAPRRDHLWVAVLIAACALLEVWASWLWVGSISGFPKIGRMTTGWILPVTTEAYWAYALWSWLAGSPGPRSKKFAMWSAFGMFVLSLAGQEAGHLVAAAHWQAPLFVAALVTPIPLTAVGLIAILVHLRQLDREEACAAQRKAEQAERRTAEAAAAADERTALRARVAELEAAQADFGARLSAELDRANAVREAELNDLRDRMASALRVERNAREEADLELAGVRAELEKMTARADRLARKLGGPAGRSGTAPARSGTAPKAAPDDDLELEARALKLLATDLDMSGAELARKLGVSEGYGRKLRRRLGGDRPAEDGQDRSGDRGGTAAADRPVDRS